MTLHQQKQIEIINQIESQLKNNSFSATAVKPVENFEEDNRIALTSVHFPQLTFVEKIYSQLSEPLKKVFPHAYFYPASSLHLTVKNIRVINDPPHFSENDIEKAKHIYSQVIPRHTSFNVFPYRLLLFKNNLALMSTTDEELDNIILDLDEELKKAGIPDDKLYVNNKYFFSNMTLARFSQQPPISFVNKIEELSNNLTIAHSYAVNSVSLITSNAVMMKKTTHGQWNLPTTKKYPS